MKMKIKCPQCEFENEEGSKFCKNCNVPLSKQYYSEQNPYIIKREINRKTIKITLSFLFIAVVYIFWMFSELIGMLSEPYSFWWWIAFIFLIGPFIWCVLRGIITVVGFIKNLFYKK